jgi:6-phosphofructokinase 1
MVYVSGLGQRRAELTRSVEMPPTSTKATQKMKIAVLTSGGDSAGMNAVVRAVVRGGIIK